MDAIRRAYERCVRAFSLRPALGRADVRTERVKTRLEWATPDQACDAAFAGGPVARAHSRFDGATRAETSAEYLASIDRWRTARGYAVPGEFAIASGRKDG